MHVFVDDSGDGGFKFDKGSSTHLVMAACVFRNPLEIEKLSGRLQECRDRRSHRQEFKHNKTRDKTKDHFFEVIRDVQFKIRTIIIDKSLIYEPYLRSSPSVLKAFAIRQLLSNSWGQIVDAKVFIDGQDTRAWGISDSAYLMRMANKKSRVISSVRFADSTQNVGIQLADMIAGAIRCKESASPTERHIKHWESIRYRANQPQGNYWRFR